ncbi:MAG: right-handed parallel beta-helix repeat-containing protein, partial [Candidatus Latescibacterota bacterium]
MTPEKADFFVAPDGRDDWSGKRSAPDPNAMDGPFWSLSRAQQAVRARKRDDPNRANSIVVQIRGGRYPLDAPLRFAPEDSGTAQAPVIYRAFPGEDPVLSGGLRIKGWQETETGWWQAHLPEVENGQSNFTQLFVENQRRYRTRLPREGYAFIAEEIPPTPGSEGKGFDRFGFHDGDLRSDWHNLSDVEALCFHIWEMSRMRLAHVDEEERIATLTGPTCRPEYYAALFKGNRFLIENVREALETPGQWYLDRASGILTYIPMPGETIETTCVIAPRVEQLLLLEGEVKNRDWVQHIRFEGITFAHANWTTPTGGHSCPQAEHALGAALYAEGARHCSFIGCTIKHVGQYALEWAEGCRDNLVERCTLTDLGGGGIRLGPSCQPEDPSDGPDEEAVSGHQTIRDCLIAHAGRLHPGAIG